MSGLMSGSSRTFGHEELGEAAFGAAVFYSREVLWFVVYVPVG
jgi:hypothetical protein